MSADLYPRRASQWPASSARAPAATSTSHAGAVSRVTHGQSRLGAEVVGSLALQSERRCPLMRNKTTEAATSEQTNDALDYTPTHQERVALKAYLERKGQRAPSPRFDVQYKGDAVWLEPDHADASVGHALVANSLATGNGAFSGGLLKQLADVSRSGKRLSRDELNFVLAIVHEIAPRDPTEALLAVQMAAIHNATITAARRLTHSETIAQQDSNSNMLNKLARTFTAQIEALKRHRSNGEQTVRVTHQHVTVNNQGGQAVVAGEVLSGGGGSKKCEDQSLEPCGSDERGPTLLGNIKANRIALQGTGSPGKEGMPMPRCEGRRTER